ncbi:phosphonate C-P lyase system protein PhnK [Oceanidesulfovibrio marinus]|uniref:Phosphonate C-P lyase system protein PhnK n=1 Tax=Oceanidesulfovibrio marinus TaxID=370038 RepID=A0A6P1ZD65_9BACT|nr:phosphonate C-P lyase system protein PhnK [Oceanidesulfovibrio marinus]TVM32277.1 phosphonate C-P lyase system protein PhnK [Oceanidesulfovibrio marinus]
MNPVLSKGDAPLLSVRGLAKYYGARVGCRDIELDLWPGEVLALVGESGSGKTTLLECLCGNYAPSAGQVTYRTRAGRVVDVHEMPEAARRVLMRTEWGMVRQNPRDGLRMKVSAGANIGERLLNAGERRYGAVRSAAAGWLERLGIAVDRLDDLPSAFSGGMQQRLQIARTLVTEPRLVFMDEPTGGLDVSAQATLLDLLRNLAQTLSLSIVLVTHDLGVARLLAHRVLVMRRGRIVEQGLADQVLDDPIHPYTQLLVSSIIHA